MPPAAGGGGGGQGGEEGSMAIIWAIAALFVIFGLIWFLYKDHIITWYLTLKLWELRGVSIVAPTTSVEYLKNFIQTTNPTMLTFEEMLKIGQMVGNYLRIPFIILLVALGVVVYFGNTTRGFKNTYSMKTLAVSEKGNWPQISPVLNLNLVQSDIDTGPWAMAMTPIQFCKKNNLIEEFRRAREGVSRREAERIEVALKRGEATRIFSLQLGPRWEGINKLPPYVKALFVVFAARINADTKVAADLVLQLNRSCASKLDFKGVDALCRKYENTKIVKKICESHAYILTMMASMIMAARLDGVQATADFLWLKPLDRRLWYVLNTMGRQTPFVESAGPYAHWLAEKEAGRKLIIPLVEGATNALEIALKAMVYHPDEDK